MPPSPVSPASGPEAVGERRAVAPPAVRDDPTIPFARYTALVQRLTGAPLAFVSFVDEDRQVFRGARGFPSPVAEANETPLRQSLCRHALDADAPLILEDAAAAEPWCTHPAVTELGVRAYLGIPVHDPEGRPVATLCAADTAPRRWSEEERAALADLAALRERDLAQSYAIWQQEADAHGHRERYFRELERLRHQQELLLNAAAEGIYGLDADGVTTFVNLSAARMLGYTLAEMRSHRQHDLIHHTRPDGSPYPADACPIYHTLRDGRVRRAEDVFWHKDGTPIPVDYTVAPIVEDGRIRGAVVTFRDLRPVKEAERQRQALEDARRRAEELEQERQRLWAILAHLPAMIGVYEGPELRLVFLNAEAEAVVGRERLGLVFAEAFPALAALGFEAKLRRVLETGEPYEERQAEVGDPEDPERRLVLRYAAVPLRDADGRVYGVLTQAIDVTAEVDAQRALEATVAELRRLAAELERSNRDLDQFAYVASHDLKAPLRAIAHLATWLEEDLGPRLEGESRRYLELLRNRVERLEGLIDGILAYSRAGRRRGSVRDVDVAALVRETIDLLAPPPDVTIEIATPLPVVRTERTALQQVWMNLLSNALKHGRGAEPPRIRLGATDAGAFWDFWVADNGPGVPPEYQERIWGIFQTLRPRDEVEGSGIGLAVVRRLAEARGGRAWVESTPGAGATFHVLWPKAEANGTEAASSPARGG